MKLVVNHADVNMGLASTQTLGPILDGLMLNTPDAIEFVDTAEQQGVRTVVERRRSCAPIRKRHRGLSLFTQAVVRL